MPDLSDLAELYTNPPKSTDLDEFADQFIKVTRLMDMSKDAFDEDVYHQCLGWLSDAFRHCKQHFVPAEFTAAVIRRRRDEEAFT